MRALQRVTFIAILAVATQSWPAIAVSADMAKAYPVRPIRLVVASNPGSSVDTISRIVAGRMGEELGQQIVVDNRTGAGGTIAGELVARSVPDGHTLFGAATASVIGPQIVKGLKYDPIRDFAAISLIAITHNILVVSSKLPVKSVRDLVAHAKANPGKLNMANAGTGQQSHLAGVLFAHVAGIDVTHVPYKGGGAAATAVVAGESQLTVIPGPAVLGHVKAGRLRAVASGGEKRSTLTPDIPTFIESGLKDFVSTGWIGFLVPKATPNPIRNRLHATLIKAVNDSATRKLMEDQGAEPVTSAPAEFAKFIEAEWARFGQAIRISNLRI